MEQLDLFSNMGGDDPVYTEYLELVKKLNYYAELYYSQDEPEISDYEYDTLNNRLKQIEKEHPEWITPDSPSVRVGWKAEKGVLVKHNVPMLSLQDVFSAGADGIPAAVFADIREHLRGHRFIDFPDRHGIP